MKTPIFRPTPLNLSRVSSLLRNGELVGVPSETVYGLAADATNPDACRKIFEAKRRPLNDPLIVHVADLNQARELTIWNDTAEAAAKRFWPGPLTMILPRTDKIHDILTSGQETVAVRMPSHPVFRQLLRVCERPLAAPSANMFGYVSPTTADHVLDGLGGRIAAILDGGACAVGLESTILSLLDLRNIQILRPGAVTMEQLRECIGSEISMTGKKIPFNVPVTAPGMLERHYSPTTPITLHHCLPPGIIPDEAAVYYSNDSSEDAEGNYFTLSADGTGESAAKNLFSILRLLDSGKWNHLHFEMAPKSDPLAIAINDRLRRAAAKS